MSVIFTNVDDVAELKSPPPLSGRSVRILIDPISEPSHREAPLSLVLFRYWPGQIGPLHSHEKSAEIYFTIKGTGSVKIDNRLYEARPMSVLYIPPKVMHQPSNLGNEDWIFIAVFIPPNDLTEIRKWKPIEHGEKSSAEHFENLG